MVIRAWEGFFFSQDVTYGPVEFVLLPIFYESHFWSHFWDGDMGGGMDLCFVHFGVLMTLRDE